MEKKLKQKKKDEKQNPFPFVSTDRFDDVRFFSCRSAFCCKKKIKKKEKWRNEGQSLNC